MEAKEGRKDQSKEGDKDRGKPCRAEEGEGQGDMSKHHSTKLHGGGVAS